MKNIVLIACAVASFAPAHASTIDLTFEGIVPKGNSTAAIGNYYNGGAGGNLGITFSSNALGLCLVTKTNGCPSNASRNGLGDPNSQNGGLAFLTGSNFFIDDAGGFSNGVSFNYTAVATAGSASVYSGLDGTGTLLGTVVLPLTPIMGCPTYPAVYYCPFVAAGLNFVGTAQSISFAGVGNQIVFDDVTFGSSTPGPSPTVTPEPSSFALLLTGTIAVAARVRRRLQQKKLK